MLGVLTLLPFAIGSAQEITLRIRPRAGDTLHTVLEQRVELAGSAEGEDRDTTMAVVTTMRVLARTIVLSSDTGATTVLSITDSVTMTTTASDSASLGAQAREMLQGKRVRLRVAPDGSARTLSETGGGGIRAGPFIERMPATLPAEPVPVGGTWQRAMEVPLAGQPGGASVGGAGISTLRATFRLDSLSQGGRLAYISMRGDVARSDTLTRAPDEFRLSMRGVITGDMIVDRRRGWLTFSQTHMTVQSRLVPPETSGGAPMLFEMRMTQRMRTMDKR
ncbi:MAG: hypothetical protein ACRENI_01545 [Gemmatimonadaceae bacterium]